MNDRDESAAPLKAWEWVANALMAGCLAVMAVAVFVNVVLRYGFGMGIASSEELSRLLFVWMVFIGATAAYPRGQHMAFTSLLVPLGRLWGGRMLKVMTRVIHALVVVACAIVAWGAWQQVVVGTGSVSVVIGYPVYLLPLPAFIAAIIIGLFALMNLISGKTIDLGHDESPPEAPATDAAPPGSVPLSITRGLQPPEGTP